MARMKNFKNPENGLIADVRYLPLEIQEEAFQKGLIPYVSSLRKK
jgi:hypothetical protein